MSKPKLVMLGRYYGSNGNDRKLPDKYGKF